jgi:hypothetical protein
LSLVAGSEAKRPFKRLFNNLTIFKRNGIAEMLPCRSVPLRAHSRWMISSERLARLG